MPLSWQKIFHNFFSYFGIYQKISLWCRKVCILGDMSQTGILLQAWSFIGMQTVEPLEVFFFLSNQEKGLFIFAYQNISLRLLCSKLDEIQILFAALVVILNFILLCFSFILSSFRKPLLYSIVVMFLDASLLFLRCPEAEALIRSSIPLNIVTTFTIDQTLNNVVSRGAQKSNAMEPALD